MFVSNLPDSLQLKQHGIIDYEIGSKIAYENATIVNREGLLRRHGHPEPSQLDGHCLMIDTLCETVSQHVVDRIECTQYLVGQVRMLEHTGTLMV